MRICLVKFGPFDFESVGDGANEPARVLNFHSLVTKERGDPGWVSRGGEGTRPVFGYWFETRSFFRSKKILKYKPCLGQHSPHLVLKSFISNCNIEQIHVIVISFVYCLVVQTITNFIKQVKP